MSPAEASLFDAMDVRDRAHSIRVGRTVARQTVDRPVVAAALLHDVGKSRAHLGLIGRVAATMVGVLGRRSWIRRFEMGDGFCGRITLYLEYPELGRSLLIEAGSDPLVSTWAAEHHEPSERWSVPTDIGKLLADADADR
jgi:hypothetical protein